jgi:hypothetical protein
MLIILVMLLIYFGRERVDHIVVNYNGRTWKVLPYPNYMQAVYCLNGLNEQTLQFLAYLKQKYHVDEDDAQIAAEGNMHADAVNAPNDVHNIVGSLLLNYNPETIYENRPGLPSTSYTTGKGDELYMLLRDKDDPEKIIDYNTILFVLLHELSHIANYNDFGHGPNFWTVFKFILSEAQSSGIYIPQDYRRNPAKYSSMMIGYNPLYDAKLPSWAGMVP